MILECQKDKLMLTPESRTQFVNLRSGRIELSKDRQAFMELVREAENSESSFDAERCPTGPLKLRIEPFLDLGLNSLLTS